jgi:fluoride ion exporter CrcB/FEX
MGSKAWRRWIFGGLLGATLTLLIRLLTVQDDLSNFPTISVTFLAVALPALVATLLLSELDVAEGRLFVIVGWTGAILTWAAFVLLLLGVCTIAGVMFVVATFVSAGHYCYYAFRKRE